MVPVAEQGSSGAKRLIGILAVSHSRRLATGLAELLVGLAGGELVVGVAGGVETLGVDAAMVGAALAELEERGASEIAVFADLGSAVFSVESAIELAELEGRAVLVDAPFVEGAIAGSMTAVTGGSLADVAEAGEAAYLVRKR